MSYKIVCSRKGSQRLLAQDNDARSLIKLIYVQGDDYDQTSAV